MKKTFKSKTIVAALTGAVALTSIGLLSNSIIHNNRKIEEQVVETVTATQDQQSLDFWTYSTSKIDNTTLLIEDSKITEGVSGDGYVYLSSANLLGYQVDFVLQQGIYLPGGETLDTANPVADTDGLAYIPDENVTVLNIVIMDGDKASQTGTAGVADANDLAVFNGTGNAWNDSGIEVWYSWADTTENNTLQRLDSVTSADKGLNWYISPETGKITLSIPIAQFGKLSIQFVDNTNAGNIVKSDIIEIQVPEFVDYGNDGTNDVTALPTLTYTENGGYRQDQQDPSPDLYVFASEFIFHSSAENFRNYNPIEVKTNLEEKIQIGGWIVLNKKVDTNGDSVLDTAQGNPEFVLDYMTPSSFENWGALDAGNGNLDWVNSPLQSGYQYQIELRDAYTYTDFADTNAQLFAYDDYQANGLSATRLANGTDLDTTLGLAEESISSLSYNYAMELVPSVRYTYEVYDGDGTNDYLGGMWGASNYKSIYETDNTGKTVVEPDAQYYVMSEAEYLENNDVKYNIFAEAKVEYNEVSDVLVIDYDLHYEYTKHEINPSTDAQILVDINYTDDANVQKTLSNQIVDFENVTYTYGDGVLAEWNLQLGAADFSTGIKSIQSVTFKVDYNDTVPTIPTYTKGVVIGTGGAQTGSIEVNVPGSEKTEVEQETANVSANYNATTNDLLVEIQYVYDSRSTIDPSKMSARGTVTYVDNQGKEKTVDLGTFDNSDVNLPASGTEPYYLTERLTSTTDLSDISTASSFAYATSNITSIDIEYLYDNEVVYIETNYDQTKSNIDVNLVSATDVLPFVWTGAMTAGVVVGSIAFVALAGGLGYYYYNQQHKSKKKAKTKK